MHEIPPEHIKFTISQLKELEVIDKSVEIVLNMKKEIEDKLDGVKYTKGEEKEWGLKI